MRITIKDLEQKAVVLNNTLGTPVEARELINGKTIFNKGTMIISQSYGGYALHEMDKDSGQRDVLGTGHIKARELAGMIDALIVGIRIGKK